MYRRWIALVVALVAAAVVASQAIGTTTKDVTVDPAAIAGAEGFTDLDELTYAQAKARLQELSKITLPSDLPGLDKIDLSGVTLGSDDGERTLTLAGKGRLPIVDASIDIDVIATWPDADSTQPELSLAVETDALQLAEIGFSSARLDVSDEGVAFAGDLKVEGRIAEALAYAGHAGDVKLEGTLGTSAEALFSGEAPASMRISATLGKADSAPAWLTKRSSTYTFSTEDGLTIDEALTVVVDGHSNDFTGHVAVPRTGEIEAEIKLVGDFDPPYGLPGDKLSDISLKLSRSEAALAFDLDGIAVSATLGRSGAQLDVDGSLTVPRLVQLGADVFGTSTTAVPGAENVSLDRISLSLAPSRFSATAKATVKGQQFDALLTLRGTKPLLSLRLPQPVKLSALVEQAGPTLGNLELPAMTLTATSLTELTPDDMTPQEAEYFGEETVTFSPGLNLNAMVAPEKLGLPAGDPVELAGSLGVGLGSLSSAPAGLKLEATVPVPQNLLPTWVTPTGPATFAFTYAKGSVAASFSTAADVTVHNRTFNTTIAGSVARAGQRTTVAFKGSLSNWSRPFGLSWLTELKTVEVGLETSFGGGQPATVDAAVTGKAKLAGKDFELELGLSKNTSTTANLTARLLGNASLGDLKSVFPAISPAVNDELRKIEVGPAAVTLIAGGGSTALELTATTRYANVSTDLLVSIRSGGFSVGLKPTKSINLRDLSSQAPRLTLPKAALVLGNAKGTRSTGQLSDGEFDFYKTLYGCAADATRNSCTAFKTLTTESGFKLLAGFELGDSVDRMADAIGIQTGGNVMLEGTVPVFGSTGFALKASLGEFRFEEAPDWYDKGSVSLEVGTEGIRFAGELGVKIARGDTYDRLRFEVAAKIGITNPSLTLTGSMKGGWKNAFGQEWLDINRVALQLGVKLTTGPEVTMGFQGDLRIGDKDIAAALKIGLAPAPAPVFVRPNLIGVSVASTAGLSLKDLVSLGEAVTGTDIDVSSMPDASLRNLYFQYSQETDADLCLTQGVRFNADLYFGTDIAPSSSEPQLDPNGCRTIDTSPETRSTCLARKSDGCLASVYGSFDRSGLVAGGELNAFELGPIEFEDSSIDLALTTTKQRLRIKGGVRVGSDDYEFASGHADLDISKDGFAFKGDASMFDSSIEGYLEANAAFDLTNPSFKIKTWLKADTRAMMDSLIGAEAQSLRPFIVGLASAVDLLMGNGGVPTFNDLIAKLEQAGMTVPSQLRTAANVATTMQDAMSDYNLGTLSLNLLLRGIKQNIGGIPSGTIMGECMGVWKNGDCWVTPPFTLEIKGVCERVGINRDSADCSWGGMMRKFVKPKIEQAFNNLTGVPLTVDGITELADRFAESVASIISLDCAYFSLDATSIAQGNVDIELATKLKFFGHPIEFGVAWDFEASGGSPKEVVKSIIMSLLSTSSITCPEPPARVDTEAPAEGQTLQATILPAAEGKMELTATFDEPAVRYPEVLVLWGDRTVETIPAGTARTVTMTHTYPSAGAYAATLRVNDAKGDMKSLPVQAPNMRPVLTELTADATTVQEGGTVTVTGKFKDAGSFSRHTVRVDWGDKSVPEVFSIPANDRSFTYTHRYLDEVDTGVKVFVTDELGAEATKDVRLSVTNAAPSNVSLRAMRSLTEAGEVPAKDVLEGTPTVYALEFTDPGERDRHDVRINWGDGTPEQNIPMVPGVRRVELKHVYENEGEFRPTVLVRDDDRGEATSTERVRVLNGAPVVKLPSDLGRFKVGENARVEGRIIDAGKTDVHTVQIDWGNAVPAAERRQTITLQPGARTFQVIKPVAAAGQHTVKVEADDGQQDGRGRAASVLTVTA